MQKFQTWIYVRLSVSYLYIFFSPPARTNPISKILAYGFSQRSFPGGAGANFMKIHKLLKVCKIFKFGPRLENALKNCFFFALQRSSVWRVNGFYFVSVFHISKMLGIRDRFDSHRNFHIDTWLFAIACGTFFPVLFKNQKIKIKQNPTECL